MMTPSCGFFAPIPLWPIPVWFHPSLSPFHIPTSPVFLSALASGDSLISMGTPDSTMTYVLFIATDADRTQRCCGSPKSPILSPAIFRHAARLTGCVPHVIVGERPNNLGQVSTINIQTKTYPCPRLVQVYQGKLLYQGKPRLIL